MEQIVTELHDISIALQIIAVILIMIAMKDMSGSSAINDLRKDIKAEFSKQIERLIKRLGDKT